VNKEKKFPVFTNFSTQKSNVIPQKRLETNSFVFDDSAIDLRLLDVTTRFDKNWPNSSTCGLRKGKKSWSLP